MVVITVNRRKKVQCVAWPQWYLDSDTFCGQQSMCLFLDRLLLLQHGSIKEQREALDQLCNNQSDR